VISSEGLTSAALCLNNIFINYKYVVRIGYWVLGGTVVVLYTIPVVTVNVVLDRSCENTSRRRGTGKACVVLHSFNLLYFI
jgi:hypothetical protein